MSGARKSRKLGKAAIAAVICASAQPVFANDSDGTPMTAGVVVERMNAPDRFLYVSGMVDAMAYERFARETFANGAQAYDGMNCIYAWFHEGGVERMQQIDSAFEKYADQIPAVVIRAMLNNACGDE